MKGILVLRRARPEDIPTLVPKLRAADRLELELSAGPDIEATLLKAITTPGENLAGEIDGELVGVGGCAFHGDVGVPWMVGTDRLVKSPLALHQLGVTSIERYAPQCAVLTNYVHAENHLHIRWLKRLGFSFGETVPEYGAGKAPFIQFYRYSNV